MRHTNEITVSRTRPRAPRLRIDDLKVASAVRLRFAEWGGESSESVALFGGIEGKGEDRIANFTQLSQAGGKPVTWSAYRVNGRWVYGSSAQRLSLVAVLD